MMSPAQTMMGAAHRRVASVVDPTIIPDLAFWYEGAGITGLVDNDPISPLLDLSGNSVTLTQGTTSAKPTYKTNILNGYPVMRFDGGDVLSGAFSINLNARFVLIIYREIVQSDNAGIVVFMPTSGNDYNQNTALVYDCGYGPDGKNFAAEGGAAIAYFIRRTGSRPAPWTVITEEFGGGTGQLDSQGVSVGTSSYGSFGTAPGGLLLGGRYDAGAINAGARLNGDIALILGYRRKLNVTEKGYLTAGYRTKYAI